MSLNYKTVYLGENPPAPLFESPTVMRRIFLGVYIVAWESTDFVVHISFDDPHFVNHVTASNIKREYEFECADIPQGNVFVRKQGSASGWISAIEILK